MWSLKICTVHWILLEGIKQNEIGDNVAGMEQMKINVTRVMARAVSAREGLVSI
jgi:hypothetical protein